MGKIYGIDVRELYEDPVASEDRLIVGGRTIYRCVPAEGRVANYVERLIQDLRSDDRLGPVTLTEEERQPGALPFPLQETERQALAICALETFIHELAWPLTHFEESLRSLLGDLDNPRIAPHIKVARAVARHAELQRLWQEWWQLAERFTSSMRPNNFRSAIETFGNDVARWRLRGLLEQMLTDTYQLPARAHDTPGAKFNAPMQGLERTAEALWTGAMAKRTPVPATPVVPVRQPGVVATALRAWEPLLEPTTQMQTDMQSHGLAWDQALLVFQQPEDAQAALDALCGQITWFSLMSLPSMAPARALLRTQMCQGLGLAASDAARVSDAIFLSAMQGMACVLFARIRPSYMGMFGRRTAQQLSQAREYLYSHAWAALNCVYSLEPCWDSASDYQETLRLMAEDQRDHRPGEDAPSMRMAVRLELLSRLSCSECDEIDEIIAAAAQLLVAWLELNEPDSLDEIEQRCDGGNYRSRLGCDADRCRRILALCGVPNAESYPHALAHPETITTGARMARLTYEMLEWYQSDQDSPVLPLQTAFADALGFTYVPMTIPWPLRIMATAAAADLCRSVVVSREAMLNARS